MQAIISNNNLTSYANWTDASASINIAAGAAANNTYLFYNIATQAIGAVRL